MVLLDEHGSLKDWWKLEDMKLFTARTQKVIDRLAGQDSYGAKINGNWPFRKRGRPRGTLQALEAAKKEEDFFSRRILHQTLLRIRRMKVGLNIAQLLAVSMSTAPGKLRTNVQIIKLRRITRNLIKEGDENGVLQRFIDS